MDMESINGILVQYMKESGMQIRHREKEYSGIVGVKYILDSSIWIGFMDMGCTYIQMDQNMKGIG